MKGLSVDVLNGNKGYDCTNGGASSKQDSFILVDQDINAPFEVKEDDIYLIVVRRNLSGRIYKHVEPRRNGEKIGSGVGPMFGGNFIYTSDSRFPNDYPLPIHDRFETQAEYNAMSV